MMYDKHALTQFIKVEATRLGFSACGVAMAEAVDTEKAMAFKTWLHQGNHAEMHYMENHLEKRLDPRLLMDGLQSIVSVALNYTPAQTLPDGEYQLAAYALGKDYHDIVKQKLHLLADHIKEILPDEERESFSYRAFSDSAPVLERYWAMKAGLGWIGRNHQLIIPKGGSMFFLGELFLNLALEYDAPIDSHCGNCHQCVDACPTGALSLTEPFCAEKCISYQTIENRGEIPASIAEKMGDTIYGCDRCQKACPWNHFATPTSEPLLQPDEALLQMTKEKWLHLTEEEYRRLFKGSAVKRAKYSGLMRNISAVSQYPQKKEEK